MFYYDVWHRNMQFSFFNELSQDVECPLQCSSQGIESESHRITLHLSLLSISKNIHFAPNVLLCCMTEKHIMAILK
jgi:hypothetical protein